MSYRILVEPAAAQHLVCRQSAIIEAEVVEHPRLDSLRLTIGGADLASIAPPQTLALARSGADAPSRIDLEDATVWYRVDRREETLTVVDVASTADDQAGVQAG